MLVCARNDRGTARSEAVGHQPAWTRWEPLTFKALSNVSSLIPQ